MDKPLKQATKDPKRLEGGKKSLETYIKKVKEDILKENKLSIFPRQITLHLLPFLLQVTLPLDLEIRISMALV